MELMLKPIASLKLIYACSIDNSRITQKVLSFLYSQACFLLPIFSLRNTVSLLALHITIILWLFVNWIILSTFDAVHV